MDDSHQMNPSVTGGSHVTVRDLLAVGFRQRRVVVASFLVIFVTAFAYVLVRPPRYEAQMKILVKRERVDPVIASEETPQRQTSQIVTEEELNSEVELLRSRDLLAAVAVATGLHERDSGLRARLRQALGWQGAPPSTEERIARAVSQLEEKLSVQAVKRSSFILVSYEDRDARLTAAVLKVLADRYMDKHLAVHRPTGALSFFEQETDRYRTQVVDLQARLVQHGKNEDIVSVQAEKETVLRQLGDLETTEHATRAQIAETAERLRVLQEQATSTPPRTTTEIRMASAQLLEDLQSRLLTLELKRIELLEAFQPDYPPVREVEKQIVTLQTAIADAKRSPLHEETTDRNPTHDYLQTELAKSRAELAALKARANAIGAIRSAYRDRARRLEQAELVHEDLTRHAKQAEQSYFTYLRKREEARISEALDVQRIVNVAVAEAPTVPFEPSGPRRAFILLLGVVIATLVSVGLAFASDYRDPSLRTPAEVQAVVGLPVLAALPKDR